jgi:hypothetical protein
MEQIVVDLEDVFRLANLPTLEFRDYSNQSILNRERESMRESQGKGGGQEAWDDIEDIDRD